MGVVDRLDGRLGVYLAGLLAPVAVLAWATGFPFLLPSLGPSAYVLATEHAATRETLVGQTVGVLVAYASVRVAVGPLSTVTLLPHTAVGIEQVAAVLVATALATVLMALVDARHAPAYATVLIFTLGIPQRGLDVLVFVGGVALLVAVHELLERAGVAPDHTAT